MSNLDDELRAAVEASEAQSPVASDVVPPEPKKQGKRSLGLLATLLVIGGGLLVLVFTGFDGDAVYSRGVDQLMDEKAKLDEAAAATDKDALREKERLLNRNTRVMGTLVKGSLKKRDQPCEYRFDIEKAGKKLPVRYSQCVVPDTFRDVPDMDVEVTVTGKLQDEGFFQAEQIMAKCPSKYDMKQRAANGEAAPHGEMGASPRVN
ncbi:MAG: cytochrome c maturation protein CcmE [Myxococcales bacterium]|nr:cytochrome c maturation protein CcmE [Myxococcales bacterium]